MSVIAHGIDIVECSRIQSVCDRHGDLFLRRVYTPAEIQYCRDTRKPTERLAGRWAVKEAVLKALGTGWRGGIEFVDIETLPDGYGKPHCRLTGKTADLAKSLGIDRVLVSISHTSEYAVGSAIAVA
jgi:holo-[acyl-carrier protein] synthase